MDQTTPDKHNADEVMPEESLQQADVAEAAAETVSDGVAFDAYKQQSETKLAEMRDQLLRAMAETENVRRRAARDVEETGKYAVTSFARDMITVAENLNLALENIPASVREEEGVMKTMVDGVEMTLRELLGALDKHGITRVDPVGQKFDHNFHQAVSQVEDPTKEPGTVLHVMQAGYVIKDRLLRPAMVVVSKQGDTEQRVNTQA